MQIKLEFAEIVSWLGEVEIVGESPGILTGLASLEEAEEGNLSFCTGSKYANLLRQTKAQVVLVPTEMEGEPVEGQVWIQVKDPSYSLAVICSHLERRLKPMRKPGIHPSAVIDQTATIAADVHVGPFCVIQADANIQSGCVLEAGVYVGERTVIGERTWLHPRVTLGHDTIIGVGCELFTGAVLGADGFGYHSTAEGHTKIPQIGRVRLGDYVEIGANAAIDRARFSETVIGDGTKLDNLVQIGHNVRIGKHCLICALVGISGSSQLGDFVTLAGQVGVAGHLKLGDRVIGLGQAGITRDFPAGQMVAGTPARNAHKQRTAEANLQRLGLWIDKVKALESKAR